MFRRPPHANPTPYLRVIHIGPPVDFSPAELDQLHAACCAYGDYELFAMGPNVYICLESAQLAAQAMQALSAMRLQAGDSSTPLDVRYCIRQRQQVCTWECCITYHGAWCNLSKVTTHSCLNSSAMVQLLVFAMHGFTCTASAGKHKHPRHRSPCFICKRLPITHTSQVGDGSDRSSTRPPSSPSHDHAVPTLIPFLSSLTHNTHRCQSNPTQQCTRTFVLTNPHSASSPPTNQGPPALSQSHQPLPTTHAFKVARGLPAPPDAVATAEELGIPGLVLAHDFVSQREEQQLLAAIDANEGGWVSLAKRRVQHYGFR